MAYVGLIKHHDKFHMQHLVDYMTSIGLDHDASNNQLTFWSRSSRSPVRERIILDIPGPQDQMLTRHYTVAKHATHYIGYYLDESDVAALQREMDNAPDAVEDARALLKDRASDQDPALRGRPISTSIAQ
jgi:hypothetical protein